MRLIGLRLLVRVIMLCIITAALMTAGKIGLNGENLAAREAFSQDSENTVKKSMDTIILLDTSGSMNGSDRTRAAIDAVKLYIDLIGSQDVRIGVIAFSGTINKVIGLTEIKSAEHREEIKSKIDGLAYDGYTDIGLSMLYGIQELSSFQDGASRPLIILFTDGNIDLDPENTNGRTDEKSYEDVRAVLDHTAGFLPIYTVGLNYNGTVNEDLLRVISWATGANSYVTNDSENLPRIFYEIFADFIKSALLDIGGVGTYGGADIPINIPNPFVDEANIVLMSHAALSHITLTDPEGRVREITSEDEDFIVSGRYSVMKLLDPARGEWILNLPEEADGFSVSLICNYKDLELVVDAQRPADDERVYFYASLSNNGVLLSDHEVYSGLAGTIMIEADGGKHELTMQNIGGGFSGSVSEAIIESYSGGVIAYIILQGSDYSRESERIRIVPRPEPTVTPAPTEPPKPTEPVSAPVASDTPEPVMTVAPDIGDDTSPAFPHSLLIAVVIAFLAVLFGALFFLKSNSAAFNGSIEVSLIDMDGYYYPPETAELSSFGKSAMLSEIVISCVDMTYVNNFHELDPVLSKIIIKPTKSGDSHAISLTNMSGTVIRESNGQIIKDKKYIWTGNTRLVMKTSDYGINVELKYKQ